jgi:hypothetical protein
MNRFLNNPNHYYFEKVNNASKACGQLFKWATAQVNSYIWLVNKF